MCNPDLDDAVLERVLDDVQIRWMELGKVQMLWSRNQYVPTENRKP